MTDDNMSAAPSGGGHRAGTAPAALGEVLALYETTQEICSRLDLDQVLLSIVRRANQLLDGDVAYLATCDDEQQVLRMRAFDNIRTPAFRSLVMEYGVGLGGAVAAQRRPLSVPDYMHDVTLDHAGYIDEVVRAEGVKATVAVPVEFENRLLAILFVAKRRRARFTARQMTLLASLGNSAAIAMNNAQVYARLTGAMDIHEKLMELALAGQGLGPVAATLADLLDGPVLLADWTGQRLAAAGPELAAPSITALRAIAQDASDFTLEGLPGQVIRLGGNPEGYLLTRPGSGDRELARIAAQQAATVFALELARIRSAEQAADRLAGNLLDELLKQPVADPAGLTRQARRLGVDLNVPHVVGIARLSGAAPARVPELWRRVVQAARFGADPDTPTTSVVRGETLALLIQTHDPAAAESEAHRVVRECRRLHLPSIVVGLGRVCGEIGDYATGFAEAERAAQAAIRLGRLAPVVAFASLDFHHLVLGARPGPDLRAIAEALLEPLATYDRSGQGGSLIATLRAYLTCCGNMEATARRLVVHPNTLRARTGRIEELTGRNLQSAETRLDLQLALAALDLTD